MAAIEKMLGSLPTTKGGGGGGVCEGGEEMGICRLTLSLSQTQWPKWESYSRPSTAHLLHMAC